MTLYKGLPLKKVETENGTVVGVTTETVNDLITAFFNEDIELGDVYDFDESYGYAVPQEVFEMEDEFILSYIRTNIDSEL